MFTIVYIIMMIIISQSYTIMIIKTYWHDDGGLLPVLFIQGLSHLFHLSHVRLAKKDTRPQKSEGTQQQRSKKNGSWRIYTLKITNNN
jgi:hypothetical protein